jgi:hypothetical protein
MAAPLLPSTAAQQITTRISSRPWATRAYLVLQTHFVILSASSLGGLVREWLARPAVPGSFWRARGHLTGGAAGLSRPGRARSPVGAGRDQGKPGKAGCGRQLAAAEGLGPADGRGLAVAARRGTGYGGDRDRERARPGGGAGTRARPGTLVPWLPLWPGPRRAAPAARTWAPAPHRPPAGDLRYRPLRFSPGHVRSDGGPRPPRAREARRPAHKRHPCRPGATARSRPAKAASRSNTGMITKCCCSIR